MPNSDNLIDTIQQNLISQATDQIAYFATMDLKYTYSQLNLDPKPQVTDRNFKILSVHYTGSSHFFTGFYRLTDMPTAFQNKNSIWRL